MEYFQMIRYLIATLCFDILFCNDMPTDDAVNQFSCDGRKYCSEMTSCEEARFFLQNCPDVEMDGDNDGIPCENQWCH